MTAVRAVLLDVDFTLCRPGPEIGPDGYVELGRAAGQALDAARYEEARLAAIADLEMHPELDHDESVWLRFTEDIVRGLGGTGPAVVEIARELVDRWEHAPHFELFDDTLPALELLRRRGLRTCLVSNTGRDLDAFVRHFSLPVDAWISSRTHGKVKPSPSIFRAALELVETRPEEAWMIGDQPADDVAGARAVGIHAILIDRFGRYPDEPHRIETLGALAGLLEEDGTSG